MTTLRALSGILLILAGIVLSFYAGACFADGKNMIAATVLILSYGFYLPGVALLRRVLNKRLGKTAK